MGPFGTGKSVACCAELKFRAEEQCPSADGIRRTRWAVIRNTKPMLYTTTIKTWKEWFPGFTIRETPFTHCNLDYPLPDGTKVNAEVIFLALDRPEDEAKLLSLELTGAWVNEAREIPENIINTLSARIMRYPAGMDAKITWYGIFMDTNPPSKRHWYYRWSEIKLWHDAEFAQDAAFFRYEDAPIIRDEYDGGWKQNPKADYVHFQNLGAEYWIKMSRGKTKDWINVNILGNYGEIMEGKPVYPEFNEQYHIHHKNFGPHPLLPVIIGWDYGVKNACVMAQIYPGFRLYVFQEFYGEDDGLDQFVQNTILPYIANSLRGHEITSVGDPAGGFRTPTDAKTCQDILASYGLPTVSMHQSQKPVARIAAIQYFLYPITPLQPRFLVSPHCSMLIAGFRGAYKYARMRSLTSYDDRYKDKPEKTPESHPHDALQYIGYYARHPNIYNVQAQPIKQADWAAFV